MDPVETQFAAEFLGGMNQINNRIQSGSDKSGLTNKLTRETIARIQQEELKAKRNRGRPSAPVSPATPVPTEPVSIIEGSGDLKPLEITPEMLKEIAEYDNQMAAIEGGTAPAAPPQVQPQPITQPEKTDSPQLEMDLSGKVDAKKVYDELDYLQVKIDKMFKTWGDHLNAISKQLNNVEEELTKIREYYNIQE